MPPGIVSVQPVVAKNHVTDGTEDKTANNNLSEEHEIILGTFRLLISDLCQQFNGGHPGGAIGMAATESLYGNM